MAVVYYCGVEAEVDNTLLLEEVVVEEGNVAAAVKDQETRLEVHDRVLV